MWQDIRYGLRVLAASKGFTAVALISLGLGICAGTSFFSEIDGLVLRTLPGIPGPDELVALQLPASYPTYLRYRDRGDLFSSTCAYVAPVPFGVAVNGRTERTWGHLVTPSYFSTLGVRPALGRFFDEDHSQALEAVVSYRFWQARLGSDASAVGKTLRINGHAATVVGVGPKDFLGASPIMYVADLWIPLSVGPGVAPELGNRALERRDLKMFQMTGRLKPGVPVSGAEAELDTVARQLEQTYGEEDPSRKGRRVMLRTGGNMLPVRKKDLPLLTALPMVVIGLLLLIACSNVAIMMIARAAGRRREIAVRLSLGASRARLVRQLLIESMLLATGASALGLLLITWMMRLVSQMRLPHAMPVSFTNIEPDGRVLLFTLALTVFTGLGFGLGPALQATRTDLAPALKDGGNLPLRGYRRLSLRNLLVFSQVASSLMVLLLTGSLVIGFERTVGIDIGFDPRNLTLISLDPVRDGYSVERAISFFQKLLDRVQALPSVTAATLTDTVPAGGSGRVTFALAGAIHNAAKNTVGKDYFATTGIPILLGRSFRKDDEASTARVVIVSEQLIREFGQTNDPLALRLEIGSGEVARFNLMAGSSLDYRVEEARRVFDVLGVAKDVRTESALERTLPAIYFPMHPAGYEQPSLQGVTLMVRSAPDVDAAGLVRREISNMDASLTPFNVRGMRDQIDQLMFPIHVGMWSYGGMGLFGLILASVGLTGVTAYTVTQRRREIGIRIALGAQRGDVLGLVMKEGVILATVGTIAGLAAAWEFTRLLSASLEVVSRITSQTASEPVLMLGAPLLLAAMALAACYLPARRSTRIDPAVVLRED